jgi:hypothetical protein
MPLLPKIKSDSNPQQPQFFFHVEFDTTIYPKAVSRKTHGFLEYYDEYRRNLAHASRPEEETVRYYSSEEAIASCCRIVADILSSALPETETVEYQAKDTGNSGSPRRNWTTSSYYKRKLVEPSFCKS